MGGTEALAGRESDGVQGRQAGARRPGMTRTVAPACLPALPHQPHLAQLVQQRDAAPAGRAPALVRPVLRPLVDQRQRHDGHARLSHRRQRHRQLVRRLEGQRAAGRGGKERL